MMFPEGVRKRCAAQHDVVGWMRSRQRGDPRLEVDQDQGGGVVEGGRH
jgi:hypothetical protein